jgi:hypothetical protein
MRYDEARGLTLQALRQQGWNQVGVLLRIIGDLKGRAQGNDPNQNMSYDGGLRFLDAGDKALLLEVVWSLIIQGILVPGLDDSNQGYPFIRLTEYGKRCVEEDRILPHDPDGYLKDFNSAVRGADPVVLEYLTESLQCYIHGLNRAAAVMLGGASEQMILLLIQSYHSSISDPASKAQFEAELAKAPSIFRKFEAFERRLARIRGNIPRNITENLDSLLRGVFDTVRSSRNDAGHPASGVQPDRDAVYSHLRLFIGYCARVQMLADWFSNNST